MLNSVSSLYLGGNPDGKWQAKDKEAAKFNRVAKIQKVYPEIDRKLRDFCSVESITERKACAFAVLMMIQSGIRIGNEDSAEGYVSKAKNTEGQVLKTYGLTTLLREHVTFKSGKMFLDFVGKKSVDQFIEISDPFLVKIGHDFYNQNFDRWLTLSDGTEITKKMVAKFVKKSVAKGFSPKDFRTFRACVEAARQTEKIGSVIIINPTKKIVTEEIKSIASEVAEVLGNTPGIAKRAYINPSILHRHWEKRGFSVSVFTKKGKKKELIEKVK